MVHKIAHTLILMSSCCSHNHWGCTAYQVCHNPQDPGWEATSGHPKGVPSCHLCSDLEMAWSAQKWAEKCQVLPVRLWPEGRQRVCEPVPLWEGGQSGDRLVRVVHTGKIVKFIIINELIITILEWFTGWLRPDQNRGWLHAEHLQHGYWQRFRPNNSSPPTMA